MAKQLLHRGTLLQVFVRTAIGPPAVFDFLCPATSKGISMKTELEDATTIECSTPNAIPTSSYLPVKTMTDATISGRLDAIKIRPLREAFRLAQAINLRLLLDLPLASGGGSWQGDFWIESLDIATADNRMVTFSATLKGDGEVPWTNAAS